MKIKSYLAVLSLALINFSCVKAVDDAKPYDVRQKVFRVIAYYQNEPYNITINQVKPNSSNSPYSVLKTTQNANFEFGFTPAAGDTIKVHATSNNGDFTIFAHYLGKDLGDITLAPANNDKYSADFIYVVPN